MPFTETSLVRRVLPLVNTQVYTSPASGRSAIRVITVHNRDKSNWLRWWFYIVESGGVAGVGNVLVSGTPQWRVPPGRSIDYCTWKVLIPHETLWCYGDRAGTIFVDGARIS